MQLCLRAGFILALLLCNVLFFLDVEARPDRVMALAFGGAETADGAPAAQAVTTLQMKKRSYGFSQPARPVQAPR